MTKIVGTIPNGYFPNGKSRPMIPVEVVEEEEEGEGGIWAVENGTWVQINPERNS